MHPTTHVVADSVPVTRLAVIRHEEAKSYFYAIGTALDTDPDISQAELIEKIEGLTSRQQLYPILHDMVDGGYLSSSTCRIGYEPTLKFYNEQKQLHEWHSIQFDKERATINLLNVLEQKKFVQLILDQFPRHINHVTITEFTEAIKEINKNQIVHLLSKLVKEGRVIEHIVDHRRFWSLNSAYKEPEKPFIATVPIPTCSEKLSDFAQTVLETIYRRPGVTSTDLRELPKFSLSKLTHALRKLKNINCVKKHKTGRTVTWYPFATKIPMPKAPPARPASLAPTHQLESSEFRNKVVVETRKHPFIKTAKLHGLVASLSKVDDFKNFLLQFDRLTGYQNNNEYRWKIKEEPAEDIDIMDFPEQHKKILKMVKSNVGIMRKTMIDRLNTAEGNFKRAVTLLQSCQLIHRKETGHTVHYYYGKSFDD